MFKQCCDLFCLGINKKRLWLTVVVMFAYIWVSDFIIHGVLLSGSYAQTPTLWRGDAEIKSFMGWLLLGQFVAAKFFSVIFAKGYEGKGLWEGVRFGLLIGPFSVSHYFIQYAVTPLPCSIFGSWVAAGLVQAAIGGAIASLVYRK